VASCFVKASQDAAASFLGPALGGALVAAGGFLNAATALGFFVVFFVFSASPASGPELRALRPCFLDAARLAQCMRLEDGERRKKALGVRRRL
jgi:hypothetical protein